MANHPGSIGPTGPFNIGDTLFKWEIRGLLGKGGHAWVYHGYDPFLDRHVAIKIIPTPPESEPERDLRQRAQREARVLSKLENENVVRLIDAGFTTDGKVYIVMEILRGRTLRDVIHALGTLNVVEALSLGAKIADGVQAAHGVNVIHRDLKPENVFVIENNGIKVLDFGIAKLFGPGAATTQRDLLHGTMKYMSPEHLQGLGVSMRSDIYALGTMLYEALCGCIPCMIGVQDPTTNALIYAQLNRMPPLLDELVPSVPRFLARAIHRMLAKAPEDRFATMAEVAEVLRAHLQRYLQESNSTAPAARELWHVAPAVSLSANLTLSHATTEVRAPSDLSPPTAPPVTLPTPQGQDTTPVSKPPFSAPGTGLRPMVSVQVTEPMGVVRGAPPTPPRPAPAVTPRVEPSQAIAPAPMRPTTEVPAPLSQAALRPAPSTSPSSSAGRPRLPRAVLPANERPNAVGPQPVRVASRLAQAPTGHHQARSSQARPQPPGNRTLLLVGFPLGAVLGLLVGILSYWHPRTASSAEEPIIVVSAHPLESTERPPPPSPEPTLALDAPAPTTPPASPPPPAATAIEPAPPPSRPPKTSTPAAATAAPPAAAPAPIAHAAAKIAPKPRTVLPRSGLWDMSDLDTPTPPKPAQPPAASKPHTTAIYGADQVAH